MKYNRYSSLRYMASFSALNYAQAIVSAGITFLLIRLVPIETFADYRFGMVCLGIVSAVGLFGADRVLVIEIIHSQAPERAVMAFWIVRILAAAGAAALLGLWIALSGHDAHSVLIAVLFSAAGFVIALRSAGWFDFDGRMRQHALVLLGERLAFGALLLGLAAWWGDALGATALGVALVASSAVFLALEIAILLRHSDRDALRTGRPDLAGLYLKYHWVWYLGLSTLLMTSIGQLVLEDRAGRIELAYLGLALQFATILRLFMQQLTKLRAPAIAELTRPEGPAARVLFAFGRDLGRLLLVGVLIVAVYGALSGYLIVALFGEQYAAAVPVNWVLSAWSLVLGTGLLVHRYVIGLGLQKSVFLFGLIWGVLGLVLVYRFGPGYGALGYALILLGCHGGSVLCQVGVVLIGARRRARRDGPGSDRAEAGRHVP